MTRCHFHIGVLERFPRLRCAVLEAGSNWISSWLDRLDHKYEVAPGVYPLKQKPSDYFRRQCYISSDPDERTVPAMIDLLGGGRFFWASDFPHPDHPPDYIPEVERLIEWLPRTLPQQDRTSIIHGDYRIDNMIYAPDRPAILAIIDWELSTLGDPLADFAYLAMNWAMPHGGRGAQLGGLDLPALGIPTLEEMTQRYCAATGRDSVPDLNWFFAYNLFRLVGIIQGIKKRTLDGNASSANAEAATARIVPLAQQAWAFAQQAQH